MNRIIAVIVCCAAVAAAQCGKQNVETEYAVVSFFIGDVSKNSGGLAIGDKISEKDVITTGNQSSCDIKIGASIIRIKEKSKMMFSALTAKNNAESTSLELAEGKLLCKPKKLLKDESFMVKTPTAIAAVRGTEFTVETDISKTTRIKVFDGKIQVAKRVKPFEDKVSQVLEGAPAVEEKQSVIITVKEVAAAEKKAEKALAQNKNADISAVITSMKDEVNVSVKDIRTFKVEDFTKEGSELIAVKEKDNEVLKQVKDAIKKDDEAAKAAKLAKKEEKPLTDGRLLITRYEIYFIKNGRVEWEGKLVNPPIRENDRLYVASDDYIFCASPEGPVFWKKAMINDGKIDVKSDTATIYISGKPQKLDVQTGKEKN